MTAAKVVAWWLLVSVAATVVLVARVEWRAWRAGRAEVAHPARMWTPGEVVRILADEAEARGDHPLHLVAAGIPDSWPDPDGPWIVADDPAGDPSGIWYARAGMGPEPHPIPDGPSTGQLATLCLLISLALTWGVLLVVTA